jgi:hypothetical protein
MGMAVFFAPVSAAKLEEFRRDPDAIEAFLYPEDDDDPAGSFDVDKAWHGLHYLLTGTADGGEGPAALAILGGEEIGEDLGMGPARFLTPSQVREVAAALAGITDAELRARFDPQRMQALDIYPDVIWVRDGDDAFDYLMDNFAPLVEFYADAAARGDGVILSLG